MSLEVCACVIVGVLVCGIAYAIYLDLTKKEKPHDCGGSGSGNDDCGRSGSGYDPKHLVSMDEVKKTVSGGNSEIRHRPTGKTSEGNRAVEKKQNWANEMSEVLTNQKIPTSEERISALEKEIAKLKKEIEKKEIEKQNQLTNSVSNSNKVQEWLETNQVPQNRIHDDGDVSSVDSTDTVHSFDSTNSKVVEKPTKELLEIATWDEISDNDKSKIQCPGCENRFVETVVHPCNHSYLCCKCASEIFPLHKYCSLCNVKVDSYESVTA